ncbi:hypothetical protein NHX12_003806 [Muraenolepis orangiensis]|uniref:Uncharacterized protein n=1 Tax=Muraenolepis orangiensis TaxID=630683 RepID=A0A9Q0DRR8_9TELE|nr:hypothetical protein NHX12_003806 [Muraenolepis orangiensis]
MASVVQERQLHEKLTECRYSFPAETQHDVMRVRAVYADLRLHADHYSGNPEKKGRKLLNLAGTIPVLFKEYQYNIPVCIWLHETHPVSRPRCSVRPSVSMVINPVCPFVDAHGVVSLPCLSNWTRGMSNLTQLVAEMRTAFQKVTPLYARTYPTLELEDPAVVQQGELGPKPGQSSQQPAAGKWEQSRVGLRRSYADELLGIDFSPPGHSWNPFTRQSTPSSNPPTPPSSSASSFKPLPHADAVNLLLSRLQLNTKSGNLTTGSGPQEAPGSGHLTPGGHDLTTGGGHLTQQPQPAQVLLWDHLPAEKAMMFRSLMTLQSRDFQPLEVLEAVRLNKDLASALKYLSHTCPICQEQVTFSKMVTMTHCPCALCEGCFRTYFTTAIKEKTVDKLVCPLCSRPDIRGTRGMEDAMDYFNLLDTQIRHFLDPQSHELFQKKLRDRALQDMPNFCWCTHHEAERLRMDCPNCGKSTCSRCRSPWLHEHQGMSCEDFRRWQLHHDPTKLQALELDSALLGNKIECPNCHLIFYLSKGGCLHFICSQCQHEFCGSCGRPFNPGSSCVFSRECASRGLHAHHPRDCLYHLRDWSLGRLHKLLQCYKVPLPPWLVPDPTSSQPSASSGLCLVLEVPDDRSREEPCGRQVLPGQEVCGLHQKERLVEVVRRAGLDPASLYGRAELEAELQRWCVAVPPPADQEEEHQYIYRLRTSLARNIPLGKDISSSSSSSRRPDHEAV